MRDAMAQSISINESMGVAITTRQKKQLDKAVMRVFEVIKSIEKEQSNG